VKRWTAEDDERLLALKAKGIKNIIIAKQLGRTEQAVISRLVVLRKQAAVLS
jgi:hypothetical protein